MSGEKTKGSGSIRDPRKYGAGVSVRREVGGGVREANRTASPLCLSVSFWERVSRSHGSCWRVCSGVGSSAGELLRLALTLSSAGKAAGQSAGLPAG